jgi:hypothetical protein
MGHSLSNDKHLLRKHMSDAILPSQNSSSSLWMLPFNVGSKMWYLW